MIEYRFKSQIYDKLEQLNKELPPGRKFIIDEYTGDAVTKVSYSEHTPELIRTVELFIKFNSKVERTLIIKDCSKMKLQSIYYDDRETLF